MGSVRQPVPEIGVSVAQTDRAASGLPDALRRPIQRSAQVRRSRMLQVSAVVALLAAAFATAWWVMGSAGQRAPVAVSVTPIVQVGAAGQSPALSASGFVVAQRRTAVATKASGRLVELRVRAGSAVRQGDLIARLDASDALAVVAAAKAAVDKAGADVTQALARAERARSDAAFAALQVDRTQSLFSQQFVSEQALEDQRRRAQALHMTVAIEQAAVRQARAALGQAEAQLALERVNLGFTEIRAPFNGVVLVKHANVGDIITPMSSANGAQGAVVTLADMSSLEVEADVAERSLAKVFEGQSVAINLDGVVGATFSGRVIGIVPAVDRAKATVTTTVRFDTLDGRILPGMSARLTYLERAGAASSPHPGAVAVNPNAIVHRDGRTLVLLARREGNDVVLEEVPVNVGPPSGAALVQVDGRLKPGDFVVQEPSASLTHGSPVRLTVQLERNR